MTEPKGDAGQGRGSGRCAGRHEQPEKPNAQVCAPLSDVRWIANGVTAQMHVRENWRILAKT